MYRAPERSCSTAAEHYSTPSVRCREPPFTQHPSHMPLERFLQSPEAQGSNSSSGKNTFTLTISKHKMIIDTKIHFDLCVILLRWQWRSKRLRWRCQPGRLPMVPWYIVSRASGSAGACGWGQEPRAFCDSSEWDEARRVRAHLQLPGQSQGEIVRGTRNSLMWSSWVLHTREVNSEKGGC